MSVSGCCSRKRCSARNSFLHWRTSPLCTFSTATDSKERVGLCRIAGRAREEDVGPPSCLPFPNVDHLLSRPSPLRPSLSLRRLPRALLPPLGSACLRWTAVLLVRVRVLLPVLLSRQSKNGGTRRSPTSLGNETHTTSTSSSNNSRHRRPSISSREHTRASTRPSSTAREGRPGRARQARTTSTRARSASASRQERRQGARTLYMATR